MTSSNVRPFLSREQQGLVVEQRELPRRRAESIAGRMRTRELTDDLESAGNEGLSWAAHRFSGTEGIPFRSFAHLLVDRAIFRFLKQEIRHRKLHAAFIVAGHGAAQIAARSGDAIDVLYDAEDVVLDKMRKYVDAKVIGGVMALVTDSQRASVDPERALLLAGVVGAVRDELAELSRADRDMFTAIYAEGRTVEELAQSLGASAVTLRARHRRLLMKLREGLQKRGYARTNE